MSSPKHESFGLERDFFKALPKVKPIISSKNVMNGSRKMTETSGRGIGWVQPKFKVSRGTQVIAENLEQKALGTLKSEGTTIDTSPQKLKNPGPPVPPKPFKKAQTQTFLNKPPLPPKPTVLQKPKVLQPPALYTASRCNQVLTNSPTPRRPLICGERSSCSQARKSSSLGRLEGRQYRGLLGEEPELTSQLVYESGYISCSLESLSQAIARLSAENPPKAPPRRRRKSHPEPIYAVIDFSKKRNRRLPLQQETENRVEASVNSPIDEISSIADSGNASKTLSDASSLTINTGIDSCDPSIGSQEDLGSNFFSEMSLTENDSANDLNMTDTLSELGIDEMARLDDKLNGALPSPVPIKKKIEFFNSRTDSQRPFKSDVKKTFESGVHQEVAAQSNISGSISETLSNRECRGISSRTSPTASLVSLCSSDSSDSKSKHSLLQNPCDPDASSISSLGDISDSTNPTSSAGDSESCSNTRNPDVTHDSPFSSTQCEERIDDAQLGNERLALQPGMSPDMEASSSEDKPSSGAPFHRPISRDDPRRKIQNRNASFGISSSMTQLSVKGGIRRASHEPTIRTNACEIPPIHSKSSTDCSTASGVNETTPLDFLQGKERKAYMTAREIASSEKVFVECLGLVCDDFRQALKSASQGDQELIIPEGELSKILHYLPQLYNLNQDLLKDFESRVSDWQTNPKIADVIVRKGPFLKMFSAYIREFQSQVSYLDECAQKYPKFGVFIKQFQQSEKCKNLSLKHYMLKPVQRLPQYRLLLEVYLKHLTESSPDYHDTLVALKIVSEVADHANNSMKIEDNFQSLLRLQSRLSDCEIIKPGRTIIKEGELHKLSRKSLQLRYFILLNDSLLYTSFTGSPSPSSGLKLHHELPLDDVEIRESPLAGANQNAYEFSVFSTERSFTLAATSEEHRKEWMDTLQNAITQWKINKQTFRAFERKRATKLGEQAPIWIPDSRVTMCQLCTTTFSLTFRRHHCRACGRVVCRNCSSHQAPLRYLKGRPARVCDKCYYAITEESSYLEINYQRPSRKSIIDLAIGTSSISIPTALIADAFDEDKVVCKEPSLESDKDNQKNRLRNVSPRLLKANDSESQLSGYLSRRTKKGWKRSWYVLKNSVLYIYKAPEDVLALETVPVIGYQVQEPVKESNETPQSIFKLHHKSTNILFQADDPANAKKWIDALVQATTATL